MKRIGMDRLEAYNAAMEALDLIKGIQAAVVRGDIDVDRVLVGNARSAVDALATNIEAWFINHEKK